MVCGVRICFAFILRNIVLLIRTCCTVLARFTRQELLQKVFCSVYARKQVKAWICATSTTS
ncbi:hypothetical protein JG688_00014281 [Phytophthora aleatoria]|uniref:Uncharacterized protein n=1 Tax=Phytophthora aleatoria TaxID=2496075 RepID=A0A8J5LXN2_9STRA|nr:hypothetical protein JG688_00014281 [Phytophthora aleatoria]